MFPEEYFPDFALSSDAGVGTAYVWPDPDPDGPLVKPLSLLAELIARTPTFRARARTAGDDVDDDDSEGVEKLIDGEHGGTKRIFYPEVDWQRHRLFPSAVIQFGPRWQWDWVASGENNYCIPEGTLRLILVDEDRKPDDVEASMRDFGNFVGNLLRDIASQFAVDDRLSGSGIRQEQVPMMAPLEEQIGRGRGYWSASFLIDWK